VSQPVSGFAKALAAMSDGGVAYVLVGVGAINFFARTPAEAYATLDLDALLEPSVENLRSALRALGALGYRFEAAGEPFVGLTEASVLDGVVRNGACLSALHRDAGQIDLLLSVSGFSYAELERDAVTFRAGDAEVRVGALEKLLRSKQASGRPKDRAFLQAFEASAVDEPDES